MPSQKYFFLTTMTLIMQIKKIIQRAGGSMTVAIDLKVTQAAVVAWHYRGKIPKKHWNYFIKRRLCSLDALFNSK